MYQIDFFGYPIARASVVYVCITTGESTIGRKRANTVLYIIARLVDNEEFIPYYILYMTF